MYREYIIKNATCYTYIVKVLSNNSTIGGYSEYRKSRKPGGNSGYE